MKFVFIAKHRAIWPVAWLCEALGVSRSGFHAWLNRSPSARSRSDEELGGKVKTSFVASDRTYGARRVWRDLLADGADCGLHRIERLMRLQGLRARPRRRRLPKDSGDRQLDSVPANLLDRQFAAERPNQKWIADFTYLWTAEGWLYVAAVIDLFSRRVVGWSMSAAMTAQLVTDALLMAVWRRGRPDALLHHSDQGSQYTSEQFQRLMADHGIVCSMSRSGNVWDNAAMESFFSSLKTERTADSDEVAQAYRYEVARGFRDDVAHLSDLISPSGEAFWPAGSLASVKPRGQSGIATSTFFLLLRLLWACGQRDCVVQAQRHVHGAQVFRADCRVRRRLSPVRSSRWALWTRRSSTASA